MGTVIHNRKSFVVITGIIISTFLFVKCINDSSKSTTANNNKNKFQEFAGSKVCAECHKKIYDTHVLTAHYLTSQPANAKNIKGSIAEGENAFYYNPNVYVSVQKRDSLFYQAEYVDGVEKYFAPINITVGSGKRGQTFLYWNNHRLFQLPLTYFTALKQWTNSPGFSNRVVFRRPITSRCLECHSTFFEKINTDTNSLVEEFDRTHIVYGVDCEKCHGPAANHVAFHQKNPSATKAQFIINPSNFTRTQSLELCQLCHGGRLTKSKPSFSFQAGEKLSDYFSMDTVQKNISNIDVHGNQYGMLIASKCFKMSKMTCVTCHNSHQNETGNKILFSQHCMSCHTEANNTFCKAKNKVGNKIINNCIDCHMPEQPSKSIMVLLQGQNIPTSATMRSHFIAVYPTETKIFLRAQKSK